MKKQILIVLSFLTFLLLLIWLDGRDSSHKKTLFWKFKLSDINSINFEVINPDFLKFKNKKQTKKSKLKNNKYKKGKNKIVKLKNIQNKKTKLSNYKIIISPFRVAAKDFSYYKNIYKKRFSSIANLIKDDSHRLNYTLQLPENISYRASSSLKGAVKDLLNLEVHADEVISINYWMKNYPKKFADKNAVLKKYKLLKPNLKILIHLRKRKKAIQILIGRKNTNKTKYYISIKDTHQPENNNRIFLLSSYIIKRFNHSLSHLASKKIIPLNKEFITKITSTVSSKYLDKSFWYGKSKKVETKEITFKFKKILLNHSVSKKNSKRKHRHKRPPSTKWVFTEKAGSTKAAKKIQMHIKRLLTLKVKYFLEEIKIKDAQSIKKNFKCLANFKFLNDDNTKVLELCAGKNWKPDSKNKKDKRIFIPLRWENKFALIPASQFNNWLKFK